MRDQLPEAGIERLRLLGALRRQRLRAAVFGEILHRGGQLAELHGVLACERLRHGDDDTGEQQKKDDEKAAAVEQHPKLHIQGRERIQPQHLRPYRTADGIVPAAVQR